MLLVVSAALRRVLGPNVPHLLCFFCCCLFWHESNPYKQPPNPPEYWRNSARRAACQSVLSPRTEITVRQPTDEDRKWKWPYTCLSHATICQRCADYKTAVNVVPWMDEMWVLPNHRAIYKPRDNYQHGKQIWIKIETHVFFHLLLSFKLMLI